MCWQLTAAIVITTIVLLRAVRRHRRPPVMLLHTPCHCGSELRGQREPCHQMTTNTTAWTVAKISQRIQDSRQDAEGDDTIPLPRWPSAAHPNSHASITGRLDVPAE